MARVDDPSIPMHALYSVWLVCGSSPQNHGIVVESESTALGTAVTTPHDDFWPRTTSDACITSKQPHRLALKIEKNKIEPPRRQTAPICLGEPRFLQGSYDCRMRTRPRSIQARSSAGDPYLSRPPLLVNCDPVPSQRNALSSLAPRIRSPRGFGPLEHHKPPCIVVFARPRRTAARLSAPTPPRSVGEVAVIRHRAPLTPEIEKAPPQPEVRHTDPNQAQLPPSQGIRRSPRPVRRPSADPVLAQPTIFASSDVAVFLSARRDEASANDTPGSQIAQAVTPKMTVT
ncbi:hypothetical protein THAOC_07527 [Thalassiosira oceanica]|uniref:Uncharacterized protein n=1 Tax=Thalassiosira oceanica TaxID=159749 RepID=K0TK94_THAOC|nr:hypothetical protein THAOC_07527 [Thalassiosira oceanica]|eukprot:EJK71067.1 hypothetical protein THAOC_07527 [Thalassiosira oceanica]